MLRFSRSLSLRVLTCARPVRTRAGRLPTRASVPITGREIPTASEAPSAEAQEAATLFESSDEEMTNAAVARVKAARAERVEIAARGGEGAAFARLAIDAGLDTDTEIRIAVLAEGDSEEEAGILMATAQRKLREKRDAVRLLDARRRALDTVLASELAALESSRPIAVRGGASTGLALGGQSPRAILLIAAHALSTVSEKPFGFGNESAVLEAAQRLGVDLSALSRRVATHAEQSALRAAKAASAAQEEGASSGDDAALQSFSEDEDMDSGAESDNSLHLRRDDEDLDPDDLAMRGISLPNHFGKGSTATLAGRRLDDIVEPVAEPLSLEYAQRIAEARARSELAFSSRILLRAIAAAALEARQGKLTGASEGATRIAERTHQSPFGADEIDVLPDIRHHETAVHPLATTPPTSVLSIADAMTALSGLAATLPQRKTALERMLRGGGLTGLEKDDSPAKVTGKAGALAREKVRAGGAARGLPSKGAGGTGDLSGVEPSTMPAWASPPRDPLPPPDADTANDIRVSMGYPRLDTQSGQTLLPGPGAERAAALRRASRRGTPATTSALALKRAQVYDAAVAAGSTDEMVRMLLADVDAEDAARGEVGSEVLRPSLLPAQYRSWTEVVSAASTQNSKRSRKADGRLSAQDKAILDAPLKVPRVAPGETRSLTPKQVRVSNALASMLSSLFSEGATGRRALREPDLYPVGLAIEVPEVTVTPCLRTAYVRWTLPPLARLLEARSVANTAPTEAFSRDGWDHLTSGTARRLMEERAAASAARVEQASRAKRKPRASDRFSADGALNSLSTRLDSDLKVIVGAAAAALERNAGELRRLAAARLRLRFVPRLEFHLWEGPRKESDKVSRKATGDALA